AAHARVAWANSFRLVPGAVVQAAVDPEDLDLRRPGQDGGRAVVEGLARGAFLKRHLARGTIPTPQSHAEQEKGQESSHGHEAPPGPDRPARSGVAQESSAGP